MGRRVGGSGGGAVRDARGAGAGDVRPSRRVRRRPTWPGWPSSTGPGASRCRSTRSARRWPCGRACCPRAATPPRPVRAVDDDRARAAPAGATRPRWRRCSRPGACAAGWVSTGSWWTTGSTSTRSLVVEDGDRGLALDVTHGSGDPLAARGRRRGHPPGLPDGDGRRRRRAAAPPVRAHVARRARGRHLRGAVDRPRRGRPAHVLRGEPHLRHALAEPLPPALHRHRDDRLRPADDGPRSCCATCPPTTRPRSTFADPRRRSRRWATGRCRSTSRSGPGWSSAAPAARRSARHDQGLRSSASFGLSASSG